MQALADSTKPITAPELSALGKRIELLRIDRGLSKGLLARQAGTSRQQLWRVMTGKSELTTSLRVRLADALRVDAGALSTSAATLTAAFVLESQPAPPSPSAPATLAEYVSSVPAMERTLASIPDGDAGWRLKRLLLDCVEDVATDTGLELPAEYFALRARVTNRAG